MTYRFVTRLEWDFTAEWIQKNINMRKCSYYIASPITQSECMCQCGYRKDDHDYDAINRPKQEQSQQDLWNFEDHSAIVPTNAFGKIEFVGFNGNTSKFVRVDSKTEIATMLELMIDVWKIERPKVLISVIGGTENFKLTSGLRELFRFGLVNAARNLDAWIITGGADVGVAKHVGEAVKHSRLNSENQKDIVVIGIAPWGVIYNKQLLENKKPSEPIQYKIEDKPIEHERFLNPNHSHYILVDNGTQHQFETETTLRAELECNTCSKYDFESIPVVLLVIDGGQSILKTVKTALLKNIPVVIVKGSGRVADLLASAVTDAEVSEYIQTDDNKKTIRTTKKCLTNGVRNCIYNKMSSTNFCEKKDIHYNINEIEACLDKFELINIFELGSGDQDLYHTMCNAIHKAKENDLVKQPTILSGNLIDFDGSVRLTADKGCKSDRLDHIMSAIQSNEMELVEILLDNGVNIKTFLTTKRLLELYNGERKSESPFRELLESLRCKKKMELTKEISMEEVGKLITHLLDDYYLQMYSPNPGIDLPDDAPFENPFLHLLIWAVLNNLRDMAKLFWRKGLDSIAAALLAHALFSEMRSKLKNASPILYEDIGANSREFMGLANGVLDRCYRTDEIYTGLLLRQDLVQWEAEFCILIAIKTNNKTFITTTACQNVFNSMWMGGMTQENGILKLLICTFIPPLIPLCVDFWNDVFREPDFDHDIDHVSIPMTLQDKDGLSSVETEISQSGPSPKESEDEKQGSHEDSDVSVSEPFIKGTSTQIGQANEDPRESRVLPREQLHKTKHEDELMKYFRRAKEKIPLFYGAPVVNFLSHVISYMAFLCLYSYVLISKFDQNFSVEDVILIVWMFNIFTDEICQVIATRYTYTEIKLKAYLADFWNIADILMILLFVVGMILKHLSYQETLEAARVVLSVNLIICFLRLLQIFSLNKELGPKLVMIIRMVRNLTSFFVMLLIFIVAYAIASHAILYPNTEITFNVLRIIFRRPYWNIYGELMLDEIEGNNDCTNIVELYRNGTQPRCPTESGKYVVPVLMGVYMLMCNILLLNLLISIFSYTYQKVQDKADKHWRVQRYRQMQDYLSRGMHIPFISFIMDIVQIIKVLKEYLRRRKPEHRTSGINVFFKPLSDDGSRRERIRKWEKTIAQDFINSKQADLESIDNSVKAIKQRLDVIDNNIAQLLYTRTTTESFGEYFCSKISKPITFHRPDFENLEQRLDHIEELSQSNIDTHEEYKPGAEQASPEKTDERVEVQSISDENLPDNERKWERTISQDSINSNKADLKRIEASVKAITLRLDIRLNQLFSKIDALEKQQHTLTATIENARLHPSQTDCVAKSESSTADEPGSVILDQRMDNREELIPRIDDTPEDH